MNLARCFTISAVLLSWAAVSADETVVYRAGQDGYHTYRIPAFILSPQGSLLAFCEGRKTSKQDHGDVDLVLKRSSDGGETWSRQQLIHEEGGDEKITIGNPCPVVDSETGTIWLPLTKNNDKVLMLSSADDGKTWNKRDITASVKKDNWTWYATGPGNGIQLTQGKHRGRLVIPCDHRVKEEKDRNLSTRSHVIYSDDQGKSWQIGGLLTAGTNECAVVELENGDLLINMRSYRGKQCRAISRSSDGGLTWSEVVDDPNLVEPICQASLIRLPLANPQGTTCLAFSNPADPKSRKNLTLRVSDDGGKTWPRSKVLCEGSSIYSSLAALPGGDIGVIYERNNYEELVFTRISRDVLK